MQATITTAVSCALLVIAGCDERAAHAPSTSAPSPSGATPITLTLSVDAGGLARSVIVHRPANAPTLAPLVLNLHGSGSTAAEQETFSGMDSLADAHGFVVAYPQGAIALGSGFAWNVGGMPLLGGAPVPADAPDDAAFLRQAIASLVATYGLDAARVYATGMSGGGRMASQIGCDLADVVAAIAPVAGLRFPSPCNGTRPVPVVAFHGTADTVNPYDGGGQAYWTESVPAAEQDWETHDRCTATPQATNVGPVVTLTSYADCGGGGVVELYTIDGAGHEWPGASGQTSAIDANAVMWAFFEGRRLP